MGRALFPAPFSCRPVASVRPTKRCDQLGALRQTRTSESNTPSAKSDRRACGHDISQLIVTASAEVMTCVSISSRSSRERGVSNRAGGFSLSPTNPTDRPPESRWQSPPRARLVAQHLRRFGPGETGRMACRC